MHQLLQTGLRYGDSCSIISALSPRKKIQLNRTVWDILPAGDKSLTDSPIIPVPGASARSFRWRLELKDIDGKDRFLIRSLDESPFSLNGQWTREAFLESHDTLIQEASHSRLIFNRKDAISDIKPVSWPEALDNQKVLESNLPVLLQGETGTGKSFMAREIHRRSGRAGEFVAINIASLSSGLVESELFGHKKGSFTGAHQDRVGSFGLAHNGTLFLDEIDSLPMDLQIKLLIFLDHGCYRPVGSIREEKSRARLIFASGQSLTQLVRLNKIRKDFYFRLSQGVVAELPPLRKSVSDINRHCQLYSLDNHISISHRLIEFYKSLPWPGNIRQLRGHLDSKKVRSRTHKLDFDESDEALLAMSSDLVGIYNDFYIRPMEDVKKDYARKAFLFLGSEYQKAAKELGVNVKTLKNWISEKEC
jgi:transcriptional regulator with PAS, ATPase and Fis domain